MSNSPLHLSARDFDAYAAEKATSKAYSLPRLEVKQRALAWARGVVGRLAELGIPVDVHGSDEHPSIRNKHRADCQWVFFWRDPTARDELDRLLDRGRSISEAIDDPSPYTRHAFLALRVTADAVEVRFAVHPDAKVDVDNLRARLAEAEDGTADGGAPLTEELTAALHALPEEFTFGVGGDRVACNVATRDAIVSMLHRATEGQEPLWIGWSVPRETAIEHADILDEQLEDALVALAPIYRLVAWSRENDHIALDRRIEGLAEERARTHAELAAENARWLAEQAAARERSMEQARARGDERSEAALPPRRPTLATLFKPPAGRAAGRGAGAEASGRRPQPGDAPRPPQGAGSDGRAATAPRAAPEPPARPPKATEEPDTRAGENARAGVIEKGARVRVRSGAFGGKIGVIGELDGRGGARVLLGLLSTRLDVDELEPVVEGRERPALATSHRKPLAPTARKTR